MLIDHAPCGDFISSQATVHQSLAVHPNIVTLHRTLETSSFLLLVLESVPGEDLFYFLEQSRDHGDDELDTEGSSDGSHHGTSSSGTSGGTAHTPPTPSLLSSFHPSQLLSQSRLKLIASMFSQMCDAVEVSPATCSTRLLFFCHRS